MVLDPDPSRIVEKRGNGVTEDDQAPVGSDPMVDTMQALESLSASELELRESLARGERLAAEARSRLQEVMRQKDEILALASHDMRTPIACLHGALDLLGPTLGNLSEDQRHLLGIVRRAADTISLLVGNLLAMTSAGAELGDDLSGTDLISVVHDVADLMSVPARRKDVVVLVDAPKAVPMIAGDPLFIRQVVANLIACSVRSTRVGTTVDVLVAPLNFREARFVVDSELDVDCVPLELVRGLLTGQRKFEAKSPHRGESLALCVVGQLVRRMGGNVSVSSRSSTSRRIEVRLPALSPLRAV